MHLTVSQKHKRFFFGLSSTGVFHTAVSGLCRSQDLLSAVTAEVKVFSQALVCLMGQSDRFNGWSIASVLNCLFVSGKVTARQNKKEEMKKYSVVVFAFISVFPDVADLRTACQPCPGGNTI